MLIIEPSEWGMRPPKNPLSKQSQIDTIYIHHVGSGDVPNIPIFMKWGANYVVKSIEEHHVENNGWSAIGYHDIILPDGTIYKCRSYSDVGAHVGRKHNRNSIGILVYGNFNYEEPTDKQLQALSELIADIEKHAGKEIPVKGHRDVANSSCPGKYLYNKLNTIKQYKDVVKDEDGDKKLRCKITNLVEQMKHKTYELSELIKNLENIS